MKKTLHFLFLTAGMALLSACTGTEAIRCEHLRLKEEIPFSAGSESRLALDFDVAFPVAGFGKEALESVRREIRTACFGYIYTDFTGEVNELAQVLRERYADDYVTSNQAFLQEMGISERETNALNWNFELKGSFGEPYGDYINYIVEHYDYMGGAHGMFELAPVVFERSTGHLVSDELFTGGISHERLLELIDRHKFDMLEDMLADGAGRDDIFYVDSIPPGTHFSVSEKGLTYYYQPYDIAPYVFGVIEITIPWEELK